MLPISSLPCCGRMPSFSDSFCAARTVASASLVSASWRSSSHSPSAIRCAFSRSIGSPSGHSLGLVGRAVAGRIVRRGMALRAIGEELDQRRALVRARALRCPANRGVNRQRVIAVDAKAGDAIADRALREGRALGAGDAREARDRPLVVHHREDDRHIVDRGEGHRGVEVAFRRRAVADPAHRRCGCRP